MAELTIVHAVGSPFDRGVTIGRKLADGHLSAVDFTRRYTRRHGLADADLEPLLTPYLAAAKNAVPRLVTHLEGVAEGSGIPFIDIFAVNAFEELYAVLELSVEPVDGVEIARVPPPIPVERCTDLLVRTPVGTILGHNEQWYSGDDGGIAVIVEHPDSDDEVATVTPVAVGTLPLVGMNASGGALGLMSLSGADERVGIPRALLARDGIEARDRVDAIAKATRKNRAGGYSYAYAFAGGDSFTLEVSATRDGLVESSVHTNHALNRAVAEVSEEPSAGSRSRFDRASTLLADNPPQSAQEVMRVLGDHGADGQDICVHPRAPEGDEGSTIQFAMVCDVEGRTMWLAPGQPCSTPFQEVRLGDLL